MTVLAAPPIAAKAGAGDGAVRRFHMLDALRGVAAIAVAVGHTEPWFGITGLRYWLAVDLFFLLSGFVLADVYAARLVSGMTARSFMIQRYLRLYPLYIVGVALSVVSVAVSRMLGHVSLTPLQFAGGIVFGILLLPSPFGNSEGNIVPLNPPGWSLIFELLPNLAFALFWRSLKLPVLAVIIGASAIGLAYAHTLGEGFGGDKWFNIWAGVPRVGFSFFMGVALQRLLPRRPIVTPWAWLAVPALMLCLFHDLPHGDRVDALIVAIVFPALLAVAVRYEPSQVRVCTVLGQMSYPLYAVHHPVAMLLERICHMARHAPEALAPVIGILFIAVMLPLSIALDRLYDMPVRRFLGRRLLTRRAMAAEEAATPL